MGDNCSCCIYWRSGEQKLAFSSVFFANLFVVTLHFRKETIQTGWVIVCICYISLSIPWNLFSLSFWAIKVFSTARLLCLLTLLLLLFVCFPVQRQFLGTIRDTICKMREKTGSDGCSDKALAGLHRLLGEPAGACESRYFTSSLCFL